LSSVAAPALAAAPPAQAPVVPAFQDQDTVAEEFEEAMAEEDHGSWGPTLWKLANFVILVGVLVYFLRGPIVGYLRGRGETIRHDLVEARKLRESAEKQLADVRSKLEKLPAELEALRVRGGEELEGERVRMQEATARERELLLERTRKDIDLRFRLARRELLTHTADLAMRLARTRIEHTITDEDRVRLVDRYAEEVRA
jgi:F-type H+-transporting ATPase subunit b